MALDRKDVDRLLAPEFIEGLTDASVGELRAKRAECRRVEDLISYLRRVLQGQIDLVLAEMELRLGEDIEDHQHRLVEDLPTILAGAQAPRGARGPSRSSEARDQKTSSRQTASSLSMPTMTEVFTEDAGLTPDEIAAIVAPDLAATAFKGGMLPGANLESFDDSELSELVARLSQHESALSAERRVLHERIDVLQRLVVHRYKSGAARADTLLEDQGAGGERWTASPEGGSR
jgi:hypothetical protein